MPQSPCVRRSAVLNRRSDRGGGAHAGRDRARRRLGGALRLRLPLVDRLHRCPADHALCRTHDIPGAPLLRGGAHHVRAGGCARHALAGGPAHGGSCDGRRAAHPCGLSRRRLRRDPVRPGGGRLGPDRRRAADPDRGSVRTRPQGGGHAAQVARSRPRRGGCRGLHRREAGPGGRDAGERGLLRPGARRHLGRDGLPEALCLRRLDRVGRRHPVCRLGHRVACGSR